MKMKNRIEILFFLGLLLITRGNAQNLITEGTDNFVDAIVTSRAFKFGTNWRGLTGSTITLEYTQNETEVNRFGEPAETFTFIPEGSSAPVEILFNVFPITMTPPFIFTLSQAVSPLVCEAITKQLPSRQILITSGTSSCNGQYVYSVIIGEIVDTAISNLDFFGGIPPNFVELNQVTSPSANTFYGLLGTTFQTTIEGTQTIIINATDIAGQPRGSILWSFKAQGTENKMGLPGSLAGVSIDNSQSGTSILRLSGVNGVHLGEYTAEATNLHGVDSASASLIQAVVPFIPSLTGQTSSSTFRVGADRAVALGDTVSIRAEDRQSNPSAATTWFYSSTAVGTFQPITTGGAYNITSQSGAGNIGRDSTLTISNIQVAQLGYYRAEAVNAHGESRSQSSLVGRSPEIREGGGVVAAGGSGDIGASFAGPIGSTVTIVAEDIEGFPDSSYRWQQISNRGVTTSIASGGRFSIGQSGSIGRLTITGVRQEDLGIYRVTATNGLTPNDVVESLVGTASTCGSGTTVTRVTNGARVQSAGYFDTFGANSFSIEAADIDGAPQGTVTWSYSRTQTGGRSTPNSLYTSITGANGGTINFFNLQDAAYGYYFPRISNLFGGSECANLVGSRLEFRTGAGQIGQGFSVSSGGSVDITASFSRGFPVAPSISWRDQNGNTITSSTPGFRITQGSGVSTLTIESVSESSIGQYTAFSSNEFGSISENSTVSIGVTLVPPKIDKGSPSTINTDGSGNIGELFKVSLGDRVTMTANDIAGVERSSIAWARIPPSNTEYITINPPDGTYSSTQTQTAQGFTVSTLSFIVGSNTFGTYRATASNSAGNDFVISSVGQAPRIEDLFTSQEIRPGDSRTVAVGGQINIAEGASVSLTATDLDGQPSRSFAWYYRNTVDGPYQPLRGSRNTRMLVDGNVAMLEISSIGRTQYGDYLVQATNEFGVSANVSTMVGGPPIIRELTGTQLNFEGEIGQDFIINEGRRLKITACVIGGFPPAPPQNFEFREEGAVLNSVPSTNDDNCFVYEEGEFELTCGTTITARTRNDLGISNMPESRVSYPAPRITRGTVACSQGSTQNSAQIGDQICLYNSTSFDITCSVDRTNIPDFAFQWQYQARNISTPSDQYTISTLNTMSSRLTVLKAGVNEVGRYTCMVNSVCGQTDGVNTDVDHYCYRYFCDDNGLIVCTQSRNGGPEVSIASSICQQSGLERPVCDRCEWEMSQWSTCSDSTCHRGRRTRTVQCVCEGEIREDRDCLARLRTSRPASSDQCGPRIRCNRPFEWRAYRFGACSATCGVSYRQRRVDCVSSITGSVVSDAECVTLFKPSTRNRCFTRLCSSCNDQMPSEDCRFFVAQMGGDCSKHFLWLDCCATCSSLA